MTFAEHTTMGMSLDRTPLSARRARRAIQEFLGDDATITLIRDAIMLTGELVTNVVAHTTAGCELFASYDRSEQKLRVEIADSSPHIPELEPVGPAPIRTGGHGLRIVDDVATCWGASGGIAGKTMWFELGP